MNDPSGLTTAVPWLAWATMLTVSGTGFTSLTSLSRPGEEIISTPLRPTLKVEGLFATGAVSVTVIVTVATLLDTEPSFAW